MNAAERKCPFHQGCPFRDCQTPDQIKARFTELKGDPTWQPLIEKMEGCPLWSKCPYSKTQVKTE